MCLRDATTGAFRSLRQRSSRDFNNWQQLTFTAAQLAKLIAHAYTLDLLVTGQGSGVGLVWTMCVFLEFWRRRPRVWMGLAQKE